MLFNALFITQLNYHSKKITPRLIGHLSTLKQQLKPNEYAKIVYGTIETWLVNQLSKEQTYATEVSCASGTGFYDTFKVLHHMIHAYICNRIRVEQRFNFCNLYRTVGAVC